MSAASQDRTSQSTPPTYAALPAPGGLPAKRRSAVPRRSWFTLETAERTYEEACRRAHAFASRYPALYRLRLRLYLPCVALAQIYLLGLLVTVPFAFPWAFRESRLLAPLYAQPALRWSCFAIVYGVWLPLAGLYLAAALRGLTLAYLAPRGTRLAEADAPRLFRLLAELCRSLDIDPVARVIISADRILEVRALPSRGLLGPAEATLIAGLPVLEELSPQQLRAQLTHELAHLATHERRFGGNVLAWRIRLRELQNAAEAGAIRRGFWACQVDEALAGMLENLLRRLGPQTLPAARHHESEADAIAGAVAGRPFAAAALVRRRLAAHALPQQFRQHCYHLAETAPRPPEDLFERRAEIARAAFSESQVHAWLRHELERKDDLADSHPPLWDRLRVLGYQLENLDDFHAFMESARPQDGLGETAARYFLGDTAGRFRAEFFEQWAAHQGKDWRIRFEAYQKLQATAEEWPGAACSSSHSPEDLWQIAVAVGNTRSWPEARPVAHRILELDPAHGDANLLEGQLLLEVGDAAGLPALERAMAADAGAVLPACTLAARFMESRGDSESAAGYKARAEERRRAERTIAEERAHVRATDTLCAADCSAQTAAALLRAVEQNASHIRAAYLLRKRVAGDQKKPLYVLGIDRRRFPFQNAPRANRLMLRRISESPGLPGDILVCVVTRVNRALLAKWNSVSGGLFWSAALRRATGHVPARNLPEAAETQHLLREPPAAPSMPARQTPAAVK